MGKVSSYSVPSGSRADLHATTEGPSLTGRTDGNQKFPLNFFVFKYVDKHVLSKFSGFEKIVNDFFMGLIFGFEVGWG